MHDAYPSPCAARRPRNAREMGQIVQGSSLFSSFGYGSRMLTTVDIDWDFAFVDGKTGESAVVQIYQMVHAWKQSQAKGRTKGLSGHRSYFTAAKATANSACEEEDESDGDDKSDVASPETRKSRLMAFGSF